MIASASTVSGSTRLKYKALEQALIRWSRIARGSGRLRRLKHKALEQALIPATQRRRATIDRPGLKHKALEQALIRRGTARQESYSYSVSSTKPLSRH